jgi:hypothetical protein
MLFTRLRAGPKDLSYFLVKAIGIVSRFLSVFVFLPYRHPTIYPNILAIHPATLRAGYKGNNTGNL